MPSNPTHDETGADIPRWAATAGRHSLIKRLASKGRRLLCASRPRRADDTSGTDVTPSGVPWPIRQRVLREYHTTNLGKARLAAEELVRAGFNTGAVPYGYRPQRVRVTPPGRRARWRVRLILEPVEASVVKMIFTWRGEDGLSVAAIRRRLGAARYPAPLDPDTGQSGVWTHGVIRAILRNPKYLGRQVWGRHHHGRRVRSTQWVWSPVWAHPPIVTIEEFAAVNRLVAGDPVTSAQA